MEAKMKRIIFCFMVVTVWLIHLTPSSVFAAQDRRIALVIGNGTYKSAPLRNPGNDATDIADALERLGFSVSLKTDADQRTMKQAIRAFGRQLRKDDVGLFYFAGHGVQVKGRNYLIPVGVKIETEASSEWPHDWSQYLVSKKFQPYRLFVDTEPESAKVRILNIKPKFHQGIMLNPGRYHIEVSANGYQTEMMWIKVKPGKKRIVKISLKKMPQSPTKDQSATHYNLGNAYGKLGRYNEAVEAYEKAIRIKPDYANAHYNLGVAYGKLNRYNEAIEAYKQAIRIDPIFADAHYNLGVAHLVLKNNEDALEEYKILKTLDKELANKLFNGINK